MSTGNATASDKESALQNKVRTLKVVGVLGSSGFSASTNRPPCPLYHTANYPHDILQQGATGLSEGLPDKKVPTRSPGLVFTVNCLPPRMVEVLRENGASKPQSLGTTSSLYTIPEGWEGCSCFRGKAQSSCVTGTFLTLPCERQGTLHHGYFQGGRINSSL